MKHLRSASPTATAEELLQVVKEQEEKIKQLSEKYSLLEGVVAQMPGHIFWKDKNSVYLGCNDYAANVAGLSSRKEIIGITDYELSWKDQADNLIAFDQKVLEEGCEAIEEEIVLLSNGSINTYVSHKKPLYNDCGDVIGLVGVSIDLTDKKQQEQLEQVQFNYDLINQIIAEMPGHVFWKDTKSIYQGCNDYTARVAGLSHREEIVGKSDYDLSWKEQAENLIALDVAVMESKQSLIREEIGMLEDKSLASVLSHKKPLFNQKQEVIGLLGISIDMTDAKKEREFKEMLMT